VKQPRDVFDFLRTKGSAVMSQVSDELMKSPAFLRALETAYQGKERLNGAVGHALKTMNVPTRSEFKRAVARIEALERELAERKREAEAPAPPATKRRPAPRRKKTPPAASGA
jgi:polyhydroxyalkanoate synthesis regulator phasin